MKATVFVASPRAMGRMPLASGSSVPAWPAFWALNRRRTFETAPNAGHVDEIIKALNVHAKFLRGALGRHIDMRFTPDLRFRHDESFAAAERLNRLLDDPRVRADVYVSPFEDDDADDSDGPDGPDGPQAAQHATGPKDES